MESLPCSSDTEIQFLPSTFFATIFFFSWLYLCFLDPLCVSKSKHASPFFILKSSFFLSLFVSFQHQYLLFSIWLCRGLLSSSFPLAIYFSCTLIFLAFARNVVHNVSVLFPQWGFCICYQIFYSFLCFLATLKPSRLAILLNCEVNPGTLGSITVPRADSSSLLALFVFFPSFLEFLSWCSHYLLIPPQHFLIHLEVTIDHVVLFLCPSIF